MIPSHLSYILMSASSVGEETLARGVVSLAESTDASDRNVGGWVNNQWIDARHMEACLAGGSFTPEPEMSVCLK